VSPDVRGKKGWLLFDVQADPGETTNLAAKHPDQVAVMDTFYDQWWDSVQPYLVNESAKGPPVNPFRERYWKQFPDEKPKN
jgi:arylsulfatase